MVGHETICPPLVRVPIEHNGIRTRPAVCSSME